MRENGEAPYRASRRRYKNKVRQTYLWPKHDLLPPKRIREVPTALRRAVLHLPALPIRALRPQLRRVIPNGLLRREWRRRRTRLYASLLEVRHGGDERRQSPLFRAGREVVFERGVDEAVCGCQERARGARDGKSAHFINLTATLNIQGSLSGRSNTFPNSRSSAVYSFRNLPATRALAVAPTPQSSISKLSMPSAAQLQPQLSTVHSARGYSCRATEQQRPNEPPNTHLASEYSK